MSVVVIEWSKFLEAQKKLDSHTFSLKNTSYSETSSERLLALVVELNELANSSKVFKFWSIKEGDKSQMLDEFADVFHFTLSLFIERGIDPSGISFQTSKAKSKEELTLLFLELISSFNKDITDSEIKSWAQRFLDLGSALGFTWEEIDKAYWTKWQVNVERQNKGY